MTSLEECSLCLLDKRIMGLQSWSGFSGGWGWVVLGFANQRPVVVFGVLTKALLKIKGVPGYYAGVLVNKAVILGVTRPVKSDLNFLIPQTKTYASRDPRLFKSLASNYQPIWRTIAEGREQSL
jgi:hypothetical protein